MGDPACSSPPLLRPSNPTVLCRAVHGLCRQLGDGKASQHVAQAAAQRYDGERSRAHRSRRLAACDIAETVSR